MFYCVMCLGRDVDGRTKSRAHPHTIVATLGDDLNIGCPMFLCYVHPVSLSFPLHSYVETSCVGSYVE